MELVGRREERRALEDVVSAVRAGGSRVLVLCGEAGIGKTVLLDELARMASGVEVVRIAGVESETEFAYAGIHKLCRSVAGHFGALAAPQRVALCTALGEVDGPTPDPFLVGLAVLNLLCEAGQPQGIVVLVDDEHWLDRASARVLAFVARRLAREPVAVVSAARVPGEEFRGLPELQVGRLPDAESRMLLARHLDGPVDQRVRERLIAEAHGNPLALLELPRYLSTAELAGGFGAPGAPRSHGLEGVYRRQIEAMPLATRQLLALAAADPAGDPDLFWSAAELLGLDAEAAAPAIDAELAEIGPGIRFRHPLIRSTAYRCVALSERRRIHGALAAVTDPGVDAESRAWHLGHAAVGPDASVAAALERSASRVQARGGVSAGAAFLQRAAELSPDRGRRCDLAIAAAAAMAQAGQLNRARDLLAVLDSAQLSSLQQARADLVRAQIAFIGNHGNQAAPLLLSAARRLQFVDATLAGEVYLDALVAAIFAGRLAGDSGIGEVAQAASDFTGGRSASTPQQLLLTGIATQYTHGFAEGHGVVCEALRDYGLHMTTEQELRWMLLACFAAARVWDLNCQKSLSLRYVQLVHDTGVISQLPLALSSRVVPLLFTGDFDEAARTAQEMGTAIEAMGNAVTPYSAIALAGWKGSRAELEALSSRARGDAERRGEGHGLTVIAWAAAVLANGCGDYPAARAAAEYASSCRGEGGASWWVLPELIEAAIRVNDTSAAAAALDRLTESTTPSGTDWSLGIEARSRALMSVGDDAEDLYLQACERFSRAGLRPDLGRTHLLYGEWLRRQRRRVDARMHLRTAVGLFESIGMKAFTQRAKRELLATGESARRRSIRPAVVELTAQELQIARLAREGLSKPDISARLFISANTVKFHLSKVFTKLGIRSRSQLASALSERGVTEPAIGLPSG